MPAIVVAPRARQDIAAAAGWYDQQRDGLGDEFVDAVADALALLTRKPERYALAYRDSRRASVDRFPYALTFRLARGVVRVVACTRHRRHPRRWQGRR